LKAISDVFNHRNHVPQFAFVFLTVSLHATMHESIPHSCPRLKLSELPIPSKNDCECPMLRIILAPSTVDIAPGNGALAFIDVLLCELSIPNLDEFG